MNARELIRALEATGLSPYKISKESGVTQPTISRILHGQPDCKYSTLEKLEATCIRLGAIPDKKNTPEPSISRRKAFSSVTVP